MGRTWTDEAGGEGIAAPSGDGKVAPLDALRNLRSYNQDVAFAPHTDQKDRRFLMVSIKRCNFSNRPMSFAEAEVGCPLDHCACGFHTVDLDVEHKCSVGDDENPDDLFFGGP